MLYIITSRSAKRRQTCDAKIIAAEAVDLTPSANLKRAFDGIWNMGPMATPDDRRCAYECYRQAFLLEINKSGLARKTIDKICKAVKNGEPIILTVNEQRKFANSVRRLLVELFKDEGLGLDIETDRHIDPLRIRDMDPLSTTERLPTTTIAYNYTEDGGAKLTKHLTVVGHITPEQIARIRNSCPNGLFVPAALGMQPAKPGKAWAEFDKDDDITFMHTHLEPDERIITTEELTRLFEDMANFPDYWHVHTENV